MDSSRIVLLVAVGVFFAFLLVKLRPKAPLSDASPRRPRRLPEERLYKRIRKLPHAAQQRLVDRLQRDLDEGDGDSDEDSDEDSER